MMLRIAALFLLLAVHEAETAPSVGDPSSEEARLSYAQDPSRLVLLGNLTVGGTPAATVCLCTDQEASEETCIDLSQTCARPDATPTSHKLPAALANGHQGYFYEGLKPALVVASGDTVDVEMAAAGVNAYDEQVVGDPALEALFAWGPDGPAIGTMGALGGGEGNHWLSGPIYVCDAEPGDVLQVDILSLKPRPNPGKDGRAFGWAGSPWWGYPWEDGFKTGEPREVVTVMEVRMDSEGRATEAVPLYSYDFKSLNVTTPCALDAAEFPCTTEAGAAAWGNLDRVYGSAERLRGNASEPYTVPCIDGKQNWEHLVYVGWPFEVPEDARDYSVAGKWRAPANLHIGIMGLAPAVGVPVSSAAPMRTGGNMDQRRLTTDASIYLPVEVYGALLSMGDGHAAMGSGEIGGTGVETSLNAKIRVTLHKAGSLPKTLKGLAGPLFENSNEWVVQGFAYSDYLRQLEDPQSSVGKASTLDRAFQTTFNETRDFLMRGFELSEDEAFQVMSLAVDFGITQVVDANLGVHAVIPKFALNTSMPAPYTPSVWTGTSVPTSDPAAVAY